MALRFTIIDQFGNNNIIDEPVGWDGINLHYIRHKDWHGFIDTVDDTLGSLQFYGSGYQLLKTAFETYGVEAQCGLLVQFQCADDDTFWDTIYQGRFSFYKYKEVQGINGCHIECSVESITNVMVLKNRYEQKVDLNSLIPFAMPSAQYNYSGTPPAPLQVISMTVSPPPDPDFVPVNDGDNYIVTNPLNGWGGSPNDIATRTSSGWTYMAPTTGQTIINVSTQSGYIYNGTAWVVYTSQLAAYPQLGGLITLPSKPITIATLSQVSGGVMPPTAQGNDTTAAPVHVSTSSGTSHSFTLEYDTSNPEVNDFSPIIQQWDDTNLVGANNNKIPNGTPVLTYRPTANYVGSTLSLKIDLTFDVYTEKSTQTNGDTTYSFDNTKTAKIAAMNVMVCKGRDDYHSAFQQHCYTQSGSNKYYTFFPPSGTSSPVSSVNGEITGTIKLQWENDNIPISEGDNLYVEFWVELDGGSDPFCIIPSGHLDLKVITGFQPTLAPVYMINETLSRVAEATTADQIRVYSEFFGRIDSLPYTVATTNKSNNGEGSMLCITNGLYIRGQLLNDGTLPPMPVSLKQLFKSLDAVYNIGMAIEPDKHRQGMHWLRIEPMEYFYPNTNIYNHQGQPFILDNVNELSIELQDDKYVGIFKNGYSRWQGEQTGGLDDFMNKREYRTSLSAAKAVLEKYCDFIGSSYAIETTRRQTGTDAQDWRFDHEIFLICTQPPLASSPITGANLNVAGGNNIYQVSFSIANVGSGYSSPPVYIVTDSNSQPVAQGLIPLSTVNQGQAINQTISQIVNIGFNPSPGYSLYIAPPGNVSAGNFGTFTSVNANVSVGGMVTSVPITPPGIGSGFAIPPIVNIAPPPASAGSSPATAIALITNGVVSGFSITNPGSGYSSTQPPAVTMSLPPIQYYQVEQFSIDNSGVLNIVSPNTAYNYRISPARNAMRWLKNIFQSYADWINGVLYFVSGEANIVAQGKYNGLTGIVPVMEHTPIAEHQNIAYSNFDTALVSNYYPLYSNQLVKFTYPLSYTQWQSIKANPYGLIGYSVNGGSTQYGWIEELKYSPFMGTAEFVLKPRIN